MVPRLGSLAKKRPHCETKEVCEENNLQLEVGRGGMWRVKGQKEGDI
jgi:hypothetical protein